MEKDKVALVEVLSGLSQSIEALNSKDIYLVDVLLHPILSNSSSIEKKTVTRFLFKIKKLILNYIFYIKEKKRFKQTDVVLFVTEPTHFNQAVPIAKQLLLRGITITFITNRISLYNSIRRNNLPVLLSFQPLLTGGDSFLKDYLEKLPKVSYRKVQKIAAEVATLYKYLKKVFEKLDPSYVFIGNDITWEGRLCARVAKAGNIRTGMVQHGLISEDLLNRFHLVDQYFVYGETSYSTLLSAGVSAEKIAVVGAPYLDGMDLQLKGVPHSFLVNNFSIGSEFILVALSGYGHKTSLENYKKSIEWIFTLLEDEKTAAVVIKLHRKETDFYYAEQLQKRTSIMGNVYIIDDSKLDKKANKPSDIFQWLSGCSCVITGTSTVAVEAMLLNIPVISIDPLAEFKGVDFIDQQAVAYCTSYDELVEAFMTRKFREQNSRFIESIFFNSNKGKACERIIEQMGLILK